MSIPRSGGLPSPARPSVPPPVPAPRSTQRLVVAGGSKTASLKPTPPPGGSINLPIGMILRCLPPEVLAAPLAEFENSGAAATEVALPLHAILNQLPSGRIEMTLQEIVAHLPPGFLQPMETIAAYLPAVIALPLMDIVMRIPPDLLSVRSDQKEVDASVAQMADPFTEEGLREQAEKARRAEGHARIVDESQVAPAEEFVPQAMSNRAVVPPPRTTSLPVVSPPVPKIPAFPPPSPPENKSPTLPLRAPAATPAPPPVTPMSAEAPVRAPLLSASQSLSASQTVPAPRTPSLRPATSAIPGFFSAKSPVSSGPLTPGQSGLILPRQPAFLPPPEATAPLPPPAGVSPSETSAAPEEAKQTVSLPPDSNVDDLQRLAALAMAQIGDEPDEDKPAPVELPVDPAAVTLPLFPRPEPLVAATARLQLPELPAREPAPAGPDVPLDESARLPNRPELSRRGITAPVPLEPEAPAPPEEEPEISSETAPADGSAIAINLNNCAAEDLLQIPAVNQEVADAIVKHRAKIGEFHKLEDLLDVPGMTAAVYHALTGESVPKGAHQSLNDLLGFPPEQNVSLKDVTDRISCWPDVTGCLLSQNSGLVLVGNVPSSLDRKAIVAFAPRMFEELNKSFSEMAGRQTDDLVIPTTGTSFHILRDKDLYLTILCRVPQMPERHLKIARHVLAALSIRPS